MTLTTLTNSLLIGLCNFPFFSTLFAIPALAITLLQKKKIDLTRFAMQMIFLAYLLCLTTIVFLPLPTAAQAARLSTYDCQMIPFHFISDIIIENHVELTRPASWIHGFFSRETLQVVLNVLLTIPFGFYLSYVHGWSRRRVLLMTFALTCFIEIAQLTGLFFTYNGSYRLCDIDDIMANTLGGFVGILLSQLAAYLHHNKVGLPTRSRNVRQKDYALAQ